MKLVTIVPPMNDAQHVCELEKLDQANAELGKEVARSKLLINRIKRDNIMSASELGLLPPKSRNGVLGHKYASSFLTQKPSILKKSIITTDIVDTPKR